MSSSLVLPRTRLPSSTDESAELAAAAIASMDRAVADNLNHPGRAGNIVTLLPQDGRDVLVSADLHGHRENFRRILQRADLSRNPRRHLVLQEVCHGGPQYADGGCRSHAMLEAVATLKSRYPGRVHFLLSNHELSEYSDYPISKSGNILLISFRMGIQIIYGEHAASVLGAYKRFIRSCPVAICLPGGAFLSHTAPENVDRRGWDVDALLRPLCDADFDLDGAIGRLVWGRDYRWPNADRFADLVETPVLIHGHTPCQAGFAVPNPRQVILDGTSRPASIALLPLGPRLDRDEIIRRVMLL